MLVHIVLFSLKCEHSLKNSTLKKESKIHAKVSPAGSHADYTVSGFGYKRLFLSETGHSVRQVYLSVTVLPVYSPADR